MSTVLAFPRPAPALQPPPRFHPDQTVQHLSTGKFGEVTHSSPDRVSVALYDRTTLVVPPHELRPVPMLPVLAIIIGGRA